MKNTKIIQQLQNVYENPELKSLFSRELGKKIMDLQTTEGGNLSEVIQMFMQEMESKVLPALKESSAVNLVNLKDQSEQINKAMKEHEKEIEHLAAEVKEFEKTADHLKKSATKLEKKTEALLKA